MAQIVINGVSFLTSPTVVQNVTIKYRLTSDADIPSSYTIVSTNVVVATDGSISPPIVIDALAADTSYTLDISNNCSGRGKTQIVLTEDPISYVWIEDLYVCEQDELITEVLSVSNFSSPNKLYYHKAQNRVYCVDSDSGSGNVFWFNPDTFSGTGSVTYNNTMLYTIYDGSIAFDDVRKKIYMAGLNTGGLIVYDMETNTVKTPSTDAQLAYGTNTAFDRLMVTYIGDFIYCSTRTPNRLVIYNANTLAKVSDGLVDTIGAGTLSLSDSYLIHEVGNERWVVPSGGRVTSGIFIYNATFTNHVTGSPITIPGAATTSFSGIKYWVSSFYDADNNRFYYHDIGSSTTTILNTVTKTIIKQIVWSNTQGKIYAQVDFNLDPNIGRLYFNYKAFNTVSDTVSSQKLRSYIFDRSALEIESMYPDLITSNLIPQTGTSFLWSAARGLAVWDGGGSWSTDGIITKLTY